MNQELQEALRKILLECFGVDINEARCYFSTQNYAFIFLGEPFMIRVSTTPKKTRAEILSELMWLDDLKAFKQTICEPHVSLRGNLLEEFEIDGKTYRASMFRTARGVIKTKTDMNPMFLSAAVICWVQFTTSAPTSGSRASSLCANPKRRIFPR